MSVLKKIDDSFFKLLNCYGIYSAMILIPIFSIAASYLLVGLVFVPLVYFDIVELPPQKMTTTHICIGADQIIELE